MRITEKRLRRVIQQVIRESMHDEMSEVAPMASVADAIRAFAASATDDDMMQFHKEGYISEEFDNTKSSKLIIDIATALRSMIKKDFREDQIESTCVLPVLRVEITFVYSNPSLADLSYTGFRMHLQTNADSIAQKMMTKCQKM